MSYWDNDRVAKQKVVTDGWNAGLSGSQIALLLHEAFGGDLPSRSAVVSKAHYLGLNKNPTRERLEANANAVTNGGGRKREAGGQAKPRRARGYAKAQAERMVGESLDEIKKRPFDVLAGSSPQPFDERVFGQCTWPVGPDKLACCTPVYRRSWCPTHWLLGVDHAAMAKPARPNMRGVQ